MFPNEGAKLPVNWLPPNMSTVRADSLPQESGMPPVRKVLDLSILQGQ